MDLDKHSRMESNKKCHWLLKALIVTFAICVIILIFVAVFLIFTQKPVDLSQTSVTSPPLEHFEEVPRSRAPVRGFRKFKTKTPTYRKFTFDDLFSGKIFLKDSYDTSWSPDGKLIRKKDEFFGFKNGLSMIDPETFMESSYLEESAFMGTVSSDGKFAYVNKIVRHGFRHSNEETYVIHEIVDGTKAGPGYAVGPTGNGTEIILLFKWNPNTDRNDFVFVHDYNIYYQSDPRRPGTAVKITSDGEEFYRYGVADWLYEEEVLQSRKAIWWSPSGRYFSYMKFDDRDVNRVYVPKYPAGSSYAQYMEIPYPKAGVENNPIGTMYIWDRKRNTVVVAMPPEELLNLNQSYYVLSNTWLTMPKSLPDLGEERMATVWADREQTIIYITLCNEDDCVVVYKQGFQINGRSMWAEPADFQSIIGTETGFFVILPQPHPDGNIYNKAAHVEIQANGLGKVTAYQGGAYDVKKLKGYNKKDDILTFTSAGGGVGTMRLFKVNNATTDRGTVESLSSQLRDCEHGAYEVSPNGETAVLSCSRIFKNTKLYIMNVKNPERNKLLDGNDDPTLPFDLPDVSFEVGKLPSGYDVHISIMKPPNFDPSKKYPVMLDVYGGPNSNRIKRSTPGPNLIHYCSFYEMIIVWVDGRGTGNRGWNIKAPVYKTLGIYEAVDTLDAVKHLAKKYSYIDENNIAIFGWSYGGFLSTHVAALDQGRTVKCAIAVAPVTDLTLYDSAYTERFMGMPTENIYGYNQSRLTNKYDKLTNVKYLLAHGEADDNVHYQHSAILSEVLQGNLIHFTQLVYSNQDHSMGGKQRHLFKEIGLFLQDCFGLNQNL